MTDGETRVILEASKNEFESLMGRQSSAEADCPPTRKRHEIKTPVKNIRFGFILFPFLKIRLFVGCGLQLSNCIVDHF
ncbi:hypothetical cytosolic protein [Syntrophus aciditrophicus SB]|uniref:Hypothetical cytosolic protein n=1 Tax=Syntrophus aciditrophicus (strain SB) TaxID=56780 RepID=Q2LW21_SYNAS|nr:hypothetical cytosolic protein [Syntrophus aciditrophicus SB]